MVDFPDFMAQYGETLIANGYRIIPITPGKKVPGRFVGREWHLFTGWQNYCERDTRSFEVDVWRKWPGCGIGLACGSVIGIDIDVDDAAVAFDIEALANEMLGETAARRIGSAPKLALYYRSDVPFKGRKRHPLEVYGVGSQMVIYAIHPKTLRPYEWPNESLAQLDISQLPMISEAQAMAWLDEAFRRLPDHMKPKTLISSQGETKWNGPSDPRGTYAAVASALQFIPNDELDGSSWILMCNAIKAALGEPGLGLWLNWSKSSAKSGASGKSDTAERRWKTAQPREVGAGTIYHWALSRGWIPEQDIFLNASKEDAAKSVHPGLSVILSEHDAPQRTTTMQPAPRPTIPDDVYNVGGIIGELVRFLVDTAHSPQPFLALGAALCAVGALAGRRYRTSSDMRTNIYAIGIVGSGGGKEYSRATIKKAIFQAGLKDYLGGGKIASGSGLLTSLEKHPCRLFLLDEFGKFIKVSTGAKAQNFKEEIWNYFMELFTSSNSVFLGTEFADQKLKPRIDIVEPCLCIYGVTTPGTFWSSLENGAMTDGSLARFLVFLTDQNYPDRRHIEHRAEIPQSILDGFQAIANGTGGGDLPVLTDAVAEAYEVPMTPGALAIERQLIKDQTAWLRSMDGTDATAIIARFSENTVKIALIKAISDNPANPVITEDDFRWAERLVDHCTRTMINEGDRYIADNPIEAANKMVLDIIRRHGEVAQNVLRRQTQKLTPKQLNDIIVTLVDMGKVHMERAATGQRGRPKVTYTYIPDDGE